MRKNGSKNITPMKWIEMAGHTAALLSAITFVPQVYKVFVSKSVGDLSLAMVLIVFSSTIIWLVYGFVLGLLPVVLANGVIFFLSALLIYFKLAYSRKK